MPEVSYKCYKSKRSFGIELEVGNEISKLEIQDVISRLCNREIKVSDWEQSISNSFWHVKQDSTCAVDSHLMKDGHKHYGWEIASFKATGYKDLLHISSVADALASYGVLTNNNCGLHIHAEVIDFTPEEMGVLMAYWLKIEPLMCCIVPQRRVNNNHCKQWSKSKKINASGNYTPRELWELCKPTNLQPHENNQKRVTLNLVNFAKAIDSERRGDAWGRKTIELRLPEGTLKGDDITNWTMLLLHFIDSVKGRQMPENLLPAKDMNEFLKIIGLSSESGFTILSKGLLRLKTWIMQRIIFSDWVASSRSTSKVFQAANLAYEKLSYPAKKCA